MRQVIYDPQWEESMTLLGAQALVTPTRLVLTEVADQVWLLLGVALFCVVALALAWSGRRRWPLQMLAWGHLLGMAPLCWWNHTLMQTLGLSTAQAVVSDLLLVVTIVPALVVSLVVLRRATPVT